MLEFVNHVRDMVYLKVQMNTCKDFYMSQINSIFCVDNVWLSIYVLYKSLPMPYVLRKLLVLRKSATVCC